MECGPKSESKKKGGRGGGGGREREGERGEYPPLPHSLAVFPTAISLSRIRPGTR